MKSSNRKYIFFISLILLMVTGTSVNAQEQKNIEKNVITAEEIARMNVSRIEEVLDTFPGVSSSAAGTTIGGSSDIIVQLDGRNLRDPISGRIRWDQISLNNVGRVEVITSGGAQYGGDSAGGVILITSRTADTFSGNLETATGNMNFKAYRGDIQTRFNDLRIGVTGSYDSDDGYRQNGHTIVKRGGLNLSYEPEPDITISPSFTYYEQVKGLGGPYFALTPYNETFYESLSATLSAKIKGLNSQTIFTDSVDQSVDRHPAPIPHDIKITPSIFSQEFSSDFSLPGSGTITAGTGYEYASIGVETNINDIQMPDALYREKKGWGFTSYKNSWDDSRYSLYLGLRGTHYNNFDNSLKPEVTIGYNEANYGATIGFSLSDRIPSYKNRYLSDAFIVANPDLQKEKYTNYNLSLFYSPHESLFFNVTSYYREVKDMISQDTVEMDIGTRRVYVNVGEATIKGVETSASWTPLPDINFSLSHNIQSAKDDNTGLWLPMRAKQRFQGKIAATPMENLSISTTVNWASKEYSNRANTISVGSWYEVDARIEYTINRYLLFFQMDNIFDKERIMPFLIPAKTRSFFVGIRYSF